MCPAGTKSGSESQPPETRQDAKQDDHASRKWEGTHIGKNGPR